ncbi:MAG: tRNA uridine-5-carboxymethylaminomethyl(34) synthesis GTPase MnmE, partial [Aestuariivita sp.]
MDTIFALATAEGKAGVAVVRISGPSAHLAAMALAGSLPPAQSSAVRMLRDAAGEVLDHALILRFDQPRSFTGEDVVELQCHGSTAIIAAVLSELSRQEGLRLAEPG